MFHLVNFKNSLKFAVLLGMYGTETFFLFLSGNVWFVYNFANELFREAISVIFVNSAFLGTGIIEILPR